MKGTENAELHKIKQYTYRSQSEPKIEARESWHQEPRTSFITLSLQ